MNWPYQFWKPWLFQNASWSDAPVWRYILDYRPLMSSWSGSPSLPLPSSSPLYSSFSRLLCGERSPPFTLAGPLVPNVQCSFFESTHLPGFHSSLSLSLTVTLILELQCDIVLMFCDLPQENQALRHSHWHRLSARDLRGQISCWRCSWTGAHIALPGYCLLWPYACWLFCFWRAGRKVDF